MGQRSCLVLCGLLFALVALPAVGAETRHSLAPIAVSPGSGEEFALLDQRCPTFSWGAVDGVRAWEIAVFAVAVATAVTDGGAERVVSRRLPGGVTSWTASGDDCLSEGRYAWVVRAREGAGPSDWSPARLFEVATRPPGAERELHALIERYLTTRPAQEPAAGGVKAETETAAPASEDSRGGATLSAAPTFQSTPPATSLPAPSPATARALPASTPRPSTARRATSIAPGATSPGYPAASSTASTTTATPWRCSPAPTARLPRRPPPAGSAPATATHLPSSAAPPTRCRSTAAPPGPVLH